MLIPRGFCGYLCPLGTLIDLFDWAIGKRVTRFRVADDGWWVHIKYYLLLGVLVALDVRRAASPASSRRSRSSPAACCSSFEPLQTGLARGWHNVPPMNAGHFVSIVLFFAVLGLGFFKPRFWCKYVCPSGAVFSLGNLFRVSERKVEDTCINCNKCVEICPFDAIKPDFTTRTTDCTLCQTCGGVCPTHAIKFVERWNRVELKIAERPADQRDAARPPRLPVAGGGLGGRRRRRRRRWRLATKAVRREPRRPERRSARCARRAACRSRSSCSCASAAASASRPAPTTCCSRWAFSRGSKGCGRRTVDADWAGCESSCNACGQVCPTGAIRALPLAEKKVARMGLAIVNQQTCLPLRRTRGVPALRR